MIISLDSNTTLFLDLYEHGSLDNILQKVQKNKTPAGYVNTKRQIIHVGIAYGMMILNQNNAIYRDLKPENIPIDKDFHP